MFSILPCLITLIKQVVGQHQVCVPKGVHYGLRQGTIAGYWGAYCRPLENMFSGNPGSCKEGGSGYDCGLAIEKNKWKIPDKYPIKF